jgi:ABC-2 type transport system permease protein
MNTSSNAMPDSPVDSREATAPVPSPTRPFVWCVRRELWENRSVYLAPLAVAGVLMFGFILSATAGIWESHLRIDATATPDKLADPYGFAAAFILGTAFIVSFFYSVDCLYGERRDRSILFWKSLPVSDLTTVLSKASIPLVVLPLLTFAIIVTTQWIMLLLSTVVLLGSGLSVATLWTHVPLFQMSLMLLYHLLTVHTLWYAPIFGWMLLVSAWARRATFLWAVLPLLAIGVVEKFAFHTSHFAAMLGYRFSGPEAFHFTSQDSAPIHRLMTLDPGRFLSAPGLWIGLGLAVIFLAAAVRLRRYREPI